MFNLLTLMNSFFSLGREIAPFLCFNCRFRRFRVFAKHPGVRVSKKYFDLFVTFVNALKPAREFS